MILEIIYILILLIISIYDIKHLIIPDLLLLLLLIITIISNYREIYMMYIGMCIYAMPLFLIWLLGVHINKELIGIGDLKLILIIGMKIKNDSFANLYLYYFITYFIGFIVVLIIKILNKKNKIIPFAPMLSLAYILKEAV